MRGLALDTLAFKVNVNRLYSFNQYTVRKSIKFYAIYVNLTTFLYTAPEKIVFIYC